MCVWVSVCFCVCVDSTGRYRWWDVAVCLTAVKNVRFSCRPLAPWLWPYVSLIAVWLHLIMPNSILLHSHRGSSNNNKTKKITSQISPKKRQRYKLTSPNWGPVISLYTVEGLGCWPAKTPRQQISLVTGAKLLFPLWCLCVWACVCEQESERKTFS